MVIYVCWKCYFLHLHQCNQCTMTWFIFQILQSYSLWMHIFKILNATYYNEFNFFFGSIETRAYSIRIIQRGKSTKGIHIQYVDLSLQWPLYVCSAQDFVIRQVNEPTMSVVVLIPNSCNELDIWLEKPEFQPCRIYWFSFCSLASAENCIFEHSFCCIYLICALKHTEIFVLIYLFIYSIISPNTGYG